MELMFTMDLDNSVRELDKDNVEILFQTRWLYPIYAIVKAIELDHNIVWYAVEENIIYISRFEWNKNKVVEKVLDLGNDKFDEWYDKNIMNDNIYDNLEPCDDTTWYFNNYNEKDWKLWDTDDLIKRYESRYPSKEYFDEME